MKPKFEVQDAHFSGKQFSLHCVIIEPGENNYVYHLSDDINHDPVFVHEVLQNIFQRWDIKSKILIIKGDNALTQYKNEYTFQPMLNLYNKYNVRTIRTYGAASHGKGLIDAMSSFSLKSVLRRDAATDDYWFQNSSEICEYLSFRCDSGMSYINLDVRKIDEKQ